MIMKLLNASIYYFFLQKNFKTKDGEQAEKEDMLRVLQDLKHVLIRTVYDNTMTNSG